MNTKPDDPMLTDIPVNFLGPDSDKAIKNMDRLDREAMIIRIEELERYNRRVEMGLARLKIALERGEI